MSYTYDESVIAGSSAEPAYKPNRDSPDYLAGVAEERDRIFEIFSSAGAKAMPAEAIRLALESNLDSLVAVMALNREARKPETARSPVELAQHQAVRRDASARPAAAGNHGWDEVVERMNAETRKANGAGAQPAAAGNHGWDEVVAKINAEARGRR